MRISLENYNGIIVLRDDKLIGGTKSILMSAIISNEMEYVYASPVYGGFQIALSAYCQKIGKKATIFCAKRKEKHINTQQCINYGAKVIEIPYGYLSVIEKRATDYCNETGAKKINFGANSDINKTLIAQRMKQIIQILNKEPKEIWCAVGSGTLVESILMATNKAKVYGVQVGAEYKKENKRLTILKYHKKFDKISNEMPLFPSTPNYDLKAWEYCLKYNNKDQVLFWNVM